MNTLLLDTDTWDLCLDASGNIAVASDPYAMAQDAASAIRLFAGEQYYDTAPGVPYFADILGHFPPLQMMKNAFVQAALTVPGVAGAICYVTEFEGRKVTGQVQITDSNGTVTPIGF